ncbi:MAG: hypothetical protein E6J61_22955 [Deltaproteobacteria bacterium]|nr:MAG: hypothetical protein E6J61_22955 [Deltaproteobacteria bacterium]
MATAPGPSEARAGWAEAVAEANPVALSAGGFGDGATLVSVPLETLRTVMARLNAWPRESAAGIENDSMASWAASSTEIFDEAEGASTVALLFASVPVAPEESCSVPDEVPPSR